jgi:hypothetical protein
MFHIFGASRRLITQRPGPRDATIATVMRWPGSLHVHGWASQVSKFLLQTAAIIAPAETAPAESICSITVKYQPRDTSQAHFCYFIRRRVNLLPRGQVQDASILL